MIRRSALTCAVFVSLLVSIPGAADPLPNYDALAGAPVREAALAEKRGELFSPARRSTFEERLGVPTFLWPSQTMSGVPVASFKGGKRAATTAVSGLEELTARGHLARYAPLYGLRSEELNTLVLTSIHDISQGPVIATFHQEIGGVEVFRDALRVVMDPSGRLVALSGYLTGSDAGAAVAASPAFALGAEEAVARVLGDLHVSAAPARAVSTPATDAHFRYFTVATSASDAIGLVEPARVKQVYFHLPDRFEPAYYVEVSVGDLHSVDSDVYSYVISASDGRVLFRNNLTADDSYTYRVWADTTGARLPFDGPQGSAGTPHPTGTPNGFQPAFVPQNVITLQNGPISTNDPWLPPGASFLTGNNVDAYADLVAPDGFSPASIDFRGAATVPGSTFDSQYSFLTPANDDTNRQAAIAQLFYDDNFFHDWYYDSGFDEISGNAQASNLGRGGIENDSMKAEAQDFGGRNNANMSTPSDGGRPRMQMYLWDQPGERSVSTTTPAVAKYTVGTAVWGPASFDLTNQIVRVDDGVAGTGGTVNDGCELPWVSNVTGKIAFVDRGGPCAGGFAQKAQNAQASGAIGIIIGNISTSNNFTVAPTMGGTPTVTVTIGVLSLNFADAEVIRGQFSPGPVNGRMFRELTRDNDGTIDNQIVAHEWAHYLSNRLVGNSNGLTNNQGRGMGEGWSDFNALLMTVKQGDDTAAPSNANYNGVYGLAGYAVSGKYSDGSPNDSYYFGIRRVPYSTDLSKDPLTFKHTADGNPIVFSGPIAFGSDGTQNAEVHNTGEVWATMLWECYAALLRDTLAGASPRLTFQQAQDRMKMYLVASLKATPNAPTILEARDAMLAVALANDPVDFALFNAAFARRGAGTRAVASDRFSIKNAPVVESFASANDIVITAISLADDVQSCDADGVLDNSEIGLLRITIKNAGAAALAGTTGTVTCANPAVTIGSLGVITFPLTPPQQSSTATVDVSMAAAVGIQNLVFNISISDPSVGTVNRSFNYRSNTDDAPATSASDDVEANASPWTATGVIPDATPGWRRNANAQNDHNWFVPDYNGTTDASLVSPTLSVGAGPFTFTFQHRWEFEYDFGNNAYDGGVVEISNNGGLTWADVGATNISPTYNATLATYTGDTNPLAGRKAYAFFTTNYPAYLTSTVNLGTAFANQNVKIRFRFGSDSGAGARGWEIDNIVFIGLTNTPFPTVVGDAGHPGCSLASTTILTSSKQIANTGDSVTFTANVSPAGIVDGSSVEFFDSNVSLGTSPTLGGQAQLSTSALANGFHAITANFLGDVAHHASTSAVLTQVVRAFTTNVLTTSLSPVTFGTPVTFTATIAPVAPATGTPVATVQFFDGTAVIGQTFTTTGVATLTASNLAIGDHSISAKFLGSTSFSDSTSTALTETINQASTTTTLTTSLTPSFFGDPVTLTASINNSSATGSVIFRDGPSAIGNIAVTGNAARQAKLTTSALSLGTHSITAEYSGDVNLAGSTSTALSQTVNLLGTPANVVAAATTATNVRVTWSAVTGATGYEVFRSPTKNGSYALVGTSMSTQFDDGTAAAVTTYLYKVRAVDASDTPSQLSQFDWATTVIFTDDPIGDATLIKLAHIGEMRAAANAFRIAFNLPIVVFPSIASGAPINAADLTAIRNALTEVYFNVLGLPAPAYTDSPLVQNTTTIKKAHISEIRALVK